MEKSRKALPGMEGDGGRKKRKKEKGKKIVKGIVVN